MKKTILAITLMIPAICAASGTINYGGRVGMDVDVVSISGLDTAKAVIRTKHTRQNAIKYCREYAGKVTKACIEEELNVPLNDEIHANCKTGVFTDFGGARLQFKGKIKNKPEDMLADYAIVDLETGEVADGSMASGYPTRMELFKALCPATAPMGDY